MNTKYAWSDFRVRMQAHDGSVVLKSTLTGSVIRMDIDTESHINQWLANQSGLMPTEIESLINPDTAILIHQGSDEYATWRARLIERRNNEAHIFILHFLPTVQCQLACAYCFENGSERMKGMSDEIINRSCEWLDDYFVAHPEIDEFRLVLFGGEPLLRKDVVAKGLNRFSALAKNRGLKFWSELISNGELLDEETASMLTKYEWSRVQITLDGPQDVHDVRRPGKKNRSTFNNIVRNIQMLLSTEYISKIDIRISFDIENANRAPELVRYLASFGAQERINLSLGLITPTLSQPEKIRLEQEKTLGEKAVATWAVAQECGFQIPDEFITGPWCIAIAKHSAVLQPNGALQKCFCTVGRSEYDFATINDAPSEYLKDARFEQWKRTDECIKEKCSYLPMCGGGCIHSALVSGGSTDGFGNRYCQKSLLDAYNTGLLHLNYG